MSWRRVQVKRVAALSVSNVDKTSSAGQSPVRLVNYTDVYYGDRIDPSLELMEATASSDQIRMFRLECGDVLITKDSETADDIGVPAYVEASTDDMILGYHLALIRPRADIVNGRFLYWTMCADSTRRQLSTGATGVTRFGLRSEVMSSLSISLPGLETQRAIADFLDAETARIDALITKKRRLSRVLKSKLESERSRVLWSGHPMTTPLKHLTPPDRQIMYGIVLPGPDVEDGVPIIKGGDVAAGLRHRLCMTTAEIESSYVRSRVRRDDLVFAIRGGIGAASLIPEDIAGANLTQDVARVSPRDSISPSWLLHVLRSPEVQSQVAQRTTGATIRGLNIAELKLILVPAIAPAEQRTQASELDRIESRLGKVSSALDAQIALLQERRQALITAAVTGQIEIPGAAA